MEALDAAMDSIYSYSAIGGGKAEAGGDPLDEFLGDLIPNTSVDNVASYLDDILGPPLDSTTDIDESAGSKDEDEYGNIISIEL